MLRMLIIRMNIEMQLDFSKNIFKQLFSGAKKDTANAYQTAFLLNGVPYYTNNASTVYDIAQARACIHAIAVNCAKLQPKYMLDNVFQEKTDLQYIIGTRPNPYMSTFEFIYKLVSMLYSSNNAFVFCDYQNGKLKGLYPIPYKSFELLEARGAFYGRFWCNNFQFVVPYEELIHLRRHFNEDELLGADQSQVLKPTIQLNNSIVESIVNGVRSSNKLQGLLKATTLVQDDELEKKRKAFVDNYMDISNTSGIAIIDNRLEFQQLKLDSILIDDKQMQAVGNDLFRYYNISEKIVTSCYSESEYNAFYNSVVEPLAIQISLELTSKLFTIAQIKAGARIVLSAERMAFASLDTRVKAIATLMPLGILSINQAKKIMELPEIENGDRHLVSLNFVDLEKANKYQVGENGNEE